MFFSSRHLMILVYFTFFYRQRGFSFFSFRKEKEALFITKRKVSFITYQKMYKYIISKVRSIKETSLYLKSEEYMFSEKGFFTVLGAVGTLILV